jgi:nucleoside-diphosphate-sugar epimerase
VVPHPRAKSAIAALAFADRGVRSSILRFSPTVHGDGDYGFIAHLVGIARDKGAAAYVDDGANRWPAVHRLDAAALVRLVVENGPAGTVAHAVAEEGVPARDIAAAIGRGLGLPVISVPADRAMDHFGWMGRFFGLDGPASSAITRAEFGWTPTHPSLLEDLGAGYYFKG